MKRARPCSGVQRSPHARIASLLRELAEAHEELAAVKRCAAELMGEGRVA